MYENGEITERIIQAIIKVHKLLGPGFLESVYRNALVLEFGDCGLCVESEYPIVIYYGGRVVGRHKLDLVVEKRVVVEIKTIEDLAQAHYAQLRSYLRASNIPLGLLVNFAKEKADFRRVELNSN
jgi:GxxExxY protein